MKPLCRFSVILILLIGLAACQPSETVVVVTATPDQNPTPTMEHWTPFPTSPPNATPANPYNPHSDLPDFTPVNTYPRLDGPVNEILVGDRFQSYPAPFELVCNVIGERPCPQVTSQSSGYQFDFSYIVGDSGFRAVNVPVYPGDHRYIIKARISAFAPTIDTMTPYSVTGIVNAYGTPGETKLHAQAFIDSTSETVFIWVLEFDEPDAIDFEIVISSQYGLSGSNFFIKYIGLEVVPGNYGDGGLIYTP